MKEPEGDTTIESTPSPALELLLECARLASDRKARDVRAYDVREVAGFADYFLVCSGTSDRHVTAVAEHIDESVRKELRLLPVGTEGLRQGRWALIDYGDVVVHVFLESVREFYRFDHLWGAAPQVELPAPETAPAGPAG